MANWVDRAFQPSDLQSGAEGAPSEARPEATLSLGEPSPRLGPDVNAGHNMRLAALAHYGVAVERSPGANATPEKSL